MKRVDLGSGIFWLGFGILLSKFSADLSLGTMEEPGPGLYTFFLGIGISLLSVIFVLQTLHKPTQPGAGSDWRGSWSAAGRPALALGMMALYVFSLDYIGFKVATFLLMFLLFRAVGRGRMGRGLSFAALVALASYFLFDLFLKIPLPKGVLGI